MDSRLKGLALGCVLVSAAALASAELAAQPDAAPPSPPAAAPAIPAADNAAPTIAAPAPTAAEPPVIVAPPGPSAAADLNAAIPAGPTSPPAAAKKGPPPPPSVVRSPVAIMQALDKVTAETMRFAAPVGRAVRYKTLIVTVRACETRDVGSPDPKSAAYVEIVSAPPGAGTGGAPPAKEVFHGWMFAHSPSLNPLQHPLYDAWLIACSATVPTA